MEFVSYTIEGGDFKRAGAASRAIKEHLKRIGAEAEAIRRTMIAAYEAEMNVVIHAECGRLEASLSDHSVDVNVIDQGPGIPDIERAMREGYSTATSEARALGFGAGMGLPNIRRNSDRLRVTSRLGEGTRVSFSVVLRPQSAGGTTRVSLYASAERCQDCRRCLAACPTGAMRVHDGRPSVLEHLCIDCTACIAACLPGALTLEDDLSALTDIERREETRLAVPPALLAGFGERVAVTRVLAELEVLGFAGLLSVEPYERALREAVLDWAAQRTSPGPVIVPSCPAVVHLIELRFPSLLTSLAPFDSPWEALQADNRGRLACVVSCPSQRSALLEAATLGGAEVVDLPTPALVRAALLPALAVGRDQGGSRGTADVTDDGAGGLLRVSGMSHVMAVLEQVENGLLVGVPVVEPYLCDGGCFGSPLLGEEGQIAAYRWTQTPQTVGEGSGGHAVARRRPYAARPGVRLDADMGVAIRKLAQLDALTRSLPGKDCSACGAPTCAALAEDVVMGRAERSLCPYAVDVEVPPS